MKNRKNILNKIYWLLFTIMALTAAFVIVTSYDSQFPIKIFTIKSGSMNPHYSQGSVVFVAKKDNYKVKDVITFNNPEKVTQSITHRISAIEYTESGKQTFTTKGDANDTKDSEKVTINNILGKVIFTIPLIGYFIILFKTKLGIVAFVLVPTTVFAVSELRNLQKLIKVYKNGGAVT